MQCSYLPLLTARSDVSPNVQLALSATPNLANWAEMESRDLARSVVWKGQHLELEQNFQ